jgi:hypothetical protein
MTSEAAEEVKPPTLEQDRATLTTMAEDLAEIIERAQKSGRGMTSGLENARREIEWASRSFRR